MQLVRTGKPVRYRIRSGSLAVIAAMLAVMAPMTASAAVLDRVRETGKLILGYEPDARPFSFEGEAGRPSGYAVALCEKVADAVKAELGLATLTLEWVPIPVEERIQAVQQGKADLLCGSATVTLASRKEADFSISIFPSGIGAILRSDSPIALREILEQGRPSSRPIWRGSPARTILEQQTFSVIKGSTSESWLADRIKAFQLTASVVPVDNYADGIAAVTNGSADVLFGDLPILLDASKRSASSGDLVVLSRYFTYAPLALAMPRGDDDFRLVVDRALSGAYRAEGFRDFFTEWFGQPDDTIVTFFRQTTLPE